MHSFNSTRFRYNRTSEIQESTLFQLSIPLGSDITKEKKPFQGGRKHLSIPLGSDITPSKDLLIKS